MPALKMKNDKPNKIIIVRKMKDYSKEPVFEKKAEEAIVFLKKHPIPESFKRKNK